MRVAFDAKRITRNTTGLGNYGRTLVGALAGAFPNDQFLLFSPSSPQPVLQKALPQSSNISYHFPACNMGELGGAIWRSYAVVTDLKAVKAEIYHGLSNELPVGIQNTAIPAVVTIHDLIFLHYPHLFSLANRIIYDLKVRHACRYANHIIAVSEATKRDLMSFYQISENKISVVYQACSPQFGTPVSEFNKQLVRQKYQLPSAYLLSVGTITAHKNLLLTLDALRLANVEMQLVVVGKKTSYFNTIARFLQKHRMENQVIFLHEVSNADLPAIYQMASLFVFPSYSEGFGIPVLEALNSGVPVIAGAETCLQEVGGPDSIYIDPRNPAELAERMKQVLYNSSLSFQMAESGKRYARGFSSINSATDLMKIYAKLV